MLLNVVNVKHGQHCCGYCDAASTETLKTECDDYSLLGAYSPVYAAVLFSRIYVVSMKSGPLKMQI